MATLGYGLNITKKPGNSRPAPPKRNPIFGEDDSDQEDDDGNDEQQAEEIGIIGDDDVSSLPSSSTAKKVRSLKSSKPSVRPPPKPSKPPTTTTTTTTNLSSALTSSKHSNEATALDPSIYDYDNSYNALHPPRGASTSAAEDAARKPKYMASLLAAADVRKRDQLRAKDKLLVREREAEGDEFADKEKFVTGAYKAQQEEVRRLEEEERLREEAERKRAGSGMGAFYRGMLDKTEKKHKEVVQAVEQQQAEEEKGRRGRGRGGAKQHDGDGEPLPSQERDNTNDKEKSDIDVARELRAKGRDVVINDEGQVVDKRQLLSAGLNVAPKPKPAQSTSTAATARDPRQQGPLYQGKAGAQQAQRERQTRMLEEQLAEASKRAADEEAEGQKGLQEASKSRKTQDEIGSAKERYLARKRERELEQEEQRKKKSKTGNEFGSSG
ncbi:MAG: hypothetical protein M1837_006220 [Sclerophora amabilis]|nr:MAG: hypothetical protein M1837_006220 [Sclerophora amabilis]